MLIHEELIEKMIALDYQGISSKGICLGFTTRWMEALHLSQEKNFNDRLIRACS